MRSLGMPIFRVVAALAVPSLLYVAPMRAQLTLPNDGETLPSFEVATIKPAAHADRSGIRWTPDGERYDNVQLSQIIRGAFDAHCDAQLAGGPQALLNQNFDVLTKMDPDDVARSKTLSRKDRDRHMALMMQALLRDRFHLKMHVEMREMPVYALVVAKGGPKLQPAASATPAPPPDPDAASPSPDMPSKMPHRLPPGAMMERMNGTSSEMAVGGGTMEQLASMLTGQQEAGGCLVVDKTGLTGKYDWYLKWASAQQEMEAHSSQDNGSAPDSDAPGLITALHDQLGLKLEPSKEPVQVVVIDHLDPPTPN